MNMDKECEPTNTGISIASDTIGSESCTGSQKNMQFSSRFTERIKNSYEIISLHRIKLELALKTGQRNAARYFRSQIEDEHRRLDELKEYLYSCALIQKE